MIVLEFKLKGKPQQYRVMDEMIRTAQFVRNKALRYWMDNQGVKLSDLYKQCAIMAKEFEWAGKLNSMARQASAERAIFAIQRFCSNCKAKKPGKKGYPQFKKQTRSVEYKTSGWKLSSDKRCLTFTEKLINSEFRIPNYEGIIRNSEFLIRNSKCRRLLRSVLYQRRTNRGSNSYR